MMIQDEPVARLRPIVAIIALGLLGAVVALLYFSSSAHGAPSVPAPTITSSPANPTTSTSANFAYKDTQSGASFKCALDSSSFSTCATTGVSYTALSYGSHTFKVEAVSGSTTSTATSYTWSVIPPTPTITSEPTNPSTSSSASFKYSDTLSGVSFECSLNGSSYSSCSSSGVTYTLSSSGSESFSVEAVSGSTASAAASYAWTVNTPAPSILTAPANPTGATTASFAYSDSQSGVSFKCALDSAGFSACASSGVSYSGLSNGNHTFKVEAELGSGPVSPAVSYSWLVDTTPPVIHVSFPASTGIYSAGTWAAGCSPTGICGTASDSQGVSSVSVGILDWSNDEYWNGSSFSSSSLVLNKANGTTNWNYPFSAPPVGIYSVYVSATDTLGNTTPSSNLYQAVFAIISGKPANITVYSGSPQSATVHKAFSSPLVAKVTDSGGNPVSGVSVTFTAPSSGASGSFASCTGGNPTSYECVETTNSSGLATSSSFTANTIAGSYTVAATTSGVSGSAGFSLTNNPGAANQLAITTGAVSGPASQSASLGPITVQVEDSYGNPVNVSSSTTIKLASSSTGGIFSAAKGGTTGTSVTISSGSSSTSFYYGDDLAGSPKITVTSGSLTSASQTESISKASPALSASGPATATVGSTIPVASISSVLSATSGSNAKGSITFEVFGPLSSAPGSCSSGGQTIGTAVTVTGNGSYSPSVGFKVTSAGDYFWYSSYSGDANNGPAASPCGSTMSETTVTGSSATQLAFTTSPVTGQAANNANLGLITVTAENSSGTATIVTSNTTVNLSSNSAGTYIFNTTEGATSPTGPTTVTIASGQSSVSFYYGDEVAGTPTITASAISLSTVTQKETINAGSPSSLTVYSGSGQSATVAANFSSPLVAKVTDAFNNPISGVSVTFSAPSGAPSGTFSNSSNTISVPTATNGQASSGSFGADTTSGSYQVSATANGLTTVYFSETNNPGTATQVVITPNPGTASASAATNIELGFQLEDQYGNLTVSSGTTNLTVGSSSSRGFFSSNNNTTGTLGQAVTVSFANGVGSANEYYGDENASSSTTITAKNGSSPFGTTTVAINPGPAVMFGVTSGTPQSATVNTSFMNPLVASVADQFGNPLSGISVIFSAPSGAPSGTFSNSSNTISVPTGTNGQASSGSFAADTTSGSYQVSATAAGLGPVYFSETNNPGSPTQVVITPNPGSASASNITNIALSFQLEDLYGNDTTSTGSTSLLLMTSSSKGLFASTAGVSGNSTMNLNFSSGAGTATLYYGDEMASDPTITAMDAPTVWGTTSVTINPGPAVISIGSGNNQSTSLSTTFADPLVVNVTDQYGNLIPGASVTFTAPSTGASGTFSNSSNTITAGAASGQVSETFTANDIGGQYDVSASAGTNTVEFVLLNGMNFTITGPTSLAPLYPGTSEALDVTIYNPNPEAITVPLSSLGGVVSGITGGDSNVSASMPACQTDWFMITKPSASDSLTINAGETVSLYGLGVAQADWPVLSMSDETTINQDNCEGASLTLSLLGTGSGGS